MARKRYLTYSSRIFLFGAAYSPWGLALTARDVPFITVSHARYRLCDYRMTCQRILGHADAERTEHEIHPVVT